METQIQNSITQESKNMVLLMWVGTIFFAFLPSLIVYLIKKDDPYIQEQAKEALNWSITAMIGYLVGAVLMVVFIGALILIAVGIAYFVFCIMGAVAASNEKPFRVPFALRLIK